MPQAKQHPSLEGTSGSRWTLTAGQLTPQDCLQTTLHSLSGISGWPSQPADRCTETACHSSPGPMSYRGVVPTAHSCPSRCLLVLLPTEERHSNCTMYAIHCFIAVHCLALALTQILPVQTQHQDCTVFSLAYTMMVFAASAQRNSAM